jgi:hypothetical protein
LADAQNVDEQVIRINQLKLEIIKNDINTIESKNSADTWIPTHEQVEFVGESTIIIVCCQIVYGGKS